MTVKAGTLISGKRGDDQEGGLVESLKESVPRVAGGQAGHSVTAGFEVSLTAAAAVAVTEKAEERISLANPC